MSMDSKNIPLLVSAKSFEKNKKITFNLNRQKIHYQDYLKLAIETKMPPGWEDYDKI